MPIIDADTHVMESERTWDYLEGDDQRFRTAAVVVTDRVTGKDRPYWLVDGRLRPRGGDPQLPVAVKEMDDIPARLRMMDQLEVEVQILYSSLFLLFVTRRPEIEVALCKSYNRWLAEIH